MKITPILMVVVVVAGMAIGIGDFYGGMADAYLNSTENYTAGSGFDVFNETNKHIDEKMYDIQNHTVGFYNKGLLDWTLYQDIALAFVDVGIILLELPRTLFLDIQHMYEILAGIPRWLPTMIGSLITIIFTLRVVDVFTKTDEI